MNLKQKFLGTAFSLLFGTSGQSLIAGELQYETKVTVAFAGESFTCFGDPSSGFKLELATFKIQGLPRPIEPSRFVSTANSQSLRDCWRRAIALDDALIGETLAFAMMVVVRHESFEIETRRHPIFMSGYSARLPIQIGAESFVGDGACEAPNHEARQRCLPE